MLFRVVSYQMAEEK